MKKIFQALLMGVLISGVALITACAGKGQADQTKSGSQSSESKIPTEQEAAQPTRQAEKEEGKKVVYTTCPGI